MFCLTVPSDPAWARAALRDLDAVLADHAHCEMKAASNALSLAARHPENPSIVAALADLAREEIGHFQEVLVWLARRSIALGPPPKDHYAAALRRVRVELGPTDLPPLVDRLLVAALIEARSCERFKLLIEVLEGEEHAELRAFYARLLAAEARHYRAFVDLAVTSARGDEAAVALRLSGLAALEGAIVSRLHEEPLRATMHG
jgi:tRNA 2-(methylsulfanyl)-N6-isopentenyladenosine37 hydroxylase